MLPSGFALRQLGQWLQLCAGGSVADVLACTGCVAVGLCEQLVVTVAEQLLKVAADKRTPTT